MSWIDTLLMVIGAWIAFNIALLAFFFLGGVAIWKMSDLSDKLIKKFHPVMWEQIKDKRERESKKWFKDRSSQTYSGLYNDDLEYLEESAKKYKKK